MSKKISKKLQKTSKFSKHLKRFKKIEIFQNLYFPNFINLLKHYSKNPKIFKNVRNHEQEQQDSTVHVDQPCSW